MELGEKIRLARTEAGLSQRQLCGEEITRNMLSQIESGKARPSMTTLQYLAAQLHRPVSYFLEDGGSPVEAALDQARQAYGLGQFQQALEALENATEKGEEANLLQYLCLIAQGKAALGQEKRPYARQLLEKAGSIETLYKNDATERERLLWLLEAGGEYEIPTDDRPLLLQAKKALQKEDPAAAIRYLDACDRQSSRWALLRGKAAFLTADYKFALELLKQAETDFPKEAIPLLEACCKELEDYKQAYYYACLQR